MSLSSPNSHYHDILQRLFTVAQSRRNARILDNICAAICRMIMAYTEGIPVEQVCHKTHAHTHTSCLLPPLRSPL